MLLKLGVSIDRVSRPIRRSFNKIDNVFRKYNLEPVVTSTYEGSHSPSSLHYDTEDFGAIDLRRVKKAEPGIIEDLKKELGKDYDVVVEESHIHCEFDPK